MSWLIEGRQVTVSYELDYATAVELCIKALTWTRSKRDTGRGHWPVFKLNDDAGLGMENGAVGVGSMSFGVTPPRMCIPRSWRPTWPLHREAREAGEHW